MSDVFYEFVTLRTVGMQGGCLSLATAFLRSSVAFDEKEIMKYGKLAEAAFQHRAMARQ